MTSAVATSGTDSTELPHVLRSGLKLGVLQAALVGAFGLLQPRLSGAVELVVLGAILVIGIGAVVALPGTWTKARSIEGIAGAAGIGLFATVVYMLIDVAVLQPLGVYFNRWQEIGGGSNWWYHPVWWMVGTFLPWMGAWVLAIQAGKSGAQNPVALVGGMVVLAALVMAAAVALRVPRAAFGLGTFAVAVLPALALLVIGTSLGARRP